MCGRKEEKLRRRKGDRKVKKRGMDGNGRKNESVDSKDRVLYRTRI